MVKRPPKSSRPAPLLTEEVATLRGKRRRPRDPEQPQLPFDPMPARIEPCLAKLVSKPPAGPNWIFEIKWDGYRLAVHLERGHVRIITRGGHDWTDRFPAIADAARALPVSTAILDGEAVVLDDAGRSDFSGLQQALGGRGGKRSASDAILYAFDLLYFDGHDITRMDQDDRRRLLADLVPEDADGAIRLSQEIEGQGAAIFAAACEHGLEGVIAKDRTKPYRSGRNGEWLKIKCVASEGFVIVGYERSTDALGGIGRLLLAARQGDGLVYVGGVGTGFSSASATALRRQMDSIAVTSPPTDTGKKRKNVVWTAPTLVAEIEFRAWTADGKLRHASYKGLRDAADADDIYEKD
ncbi:non-homologous end-joining DNA ligase [Shinella sp.]|uniref:non-homologous end-joining DNA ligase n=1 Tax=Shinella sp. TaxID=1870904 RepID=UPI003F6E6F6D